MVKQSVERPVRYILMPAEGFVSPLLASPQFRPGPGTVAVAARKAAVGSPQMRVIDSIHENAAKLVEMPPEGELSLRLSVPGVKIVREVFYKPLRYRLFPLEKPQRLARAAAARAAEADIAVSDRATGKALPGAQIVAFTDFARRAGVSAVTGRNGRARLRGISRRQKLDRIYVYAPAGYWGFYKADTTAAQSSAVRLPVVDINDAKLLLAQLYGALPGDAGNGVTIGIIDTGVDGAHPDLTNVTGGHNLVGDEIRSDPAADANWRPALIDGEHGTHVAGIAAARGRPGGFRGVAPGATIRAYRVFPDNGDGASNFDIAKAIEKAVEEGCDIINLSLGGGPSDPLTRAAIVRALAAGVVVVAAAGNDDRSPVSFPGAFPECVAVTAMGRRGSFPKNALGAGDIAKPSGGKAGEDFLAGFSNIGQEIDVTGPGVEIVSTLPGGGHGPMSGTSMASPAVAGFAAHLLSANPSLLALQGEERSRRLKDLLYSSCVPEGFGRNFEGFGLPHS